MFRGIKRVVIGLPHGGDELVVWSQAVGNFLSQGSARHHQLVPALEDAKLWA